MDLIADTLTRLRNAALVKQPKVSVHRSAMVSEILRILKEEGFLTEVTEEAGMLTAGLAYIRGVPILSGLKQLSSTGRRVYTSTKELKPILNGRGVGIISTSKGVMSVDDARKKKIGGEYICQVW